MMTRLEFGEWVKEHRLNMGLSLRQLAKKIDVSHSHISNIESGARIPNIEFCAKFAKLIGANLEEVERYAGLRPANYIPFAPQSVNPLAIKIADMLNTLSPTDQELVLKITELVVNGHGNECLVMGRASPVKRLNPPDKAKAPA